MNKEEAEEKLAEAMNNLADKLARFQDPVLWQKIMSDAARTLPGFPGLPGPVQLQGLDPLRAAVRVEAVTVSLSDEAREALVAKVYDAVQPEIAGFNDFVKEALRKMPEHRLQKLGEKVAAGVKLSLRQRPGCVFISAGDDDTYLGL